jgi:hypothetical protein
MCSKSSRSGQREFLRKTFEVARATGNHLIVQVKGNQPKLLRQVKALAREAPALSAHRQFDPQRQRMEGREVRVFAAAALPTEWDGLISTVIEVQRTRDVLSPKRGEWRKTQQVGYYVSDCAPTVGAPFYAQAIRGHGSIESAPQAHGKEVQDELTGLCISCTGDEGRPFGVGFQEQAPNHSKPLRSRAVGGEHGSQSVGDVPRAGVGEARRTQVSPCGRVVSQRLVVETRGVSISWEKLAADLVYGAGGDRRIEGATLIQALVWNCGNQSFRGIRRSSSGNHHGARA